jgi:hypothetical protein
MEILKELITRKKRLTLEQFNTEVDRISQLPVEDANREIDLLHENWRMQKSLIPQREEKRPKIKWKGSFQELNSEVERLSTMSPEDADGEIDRINRKLENPVDRFVVTPARRLKQGIEQVISRVK